MKVKDILKESYMSSAKQTERMDKVFRASSQEDAMRIVYMWIKQGVISLKEFKELMKMYMV